MKAKLTRIDVGEPPAAGVYTILWSQRVGTHFAMLPAVRLDDDGTGRPGWGFSNEFMRRTTFRTLADAQRASDEIHRIYGPAQSVSVIVADGCGPDTWRDQKTRDKYLYAWQWADKYPGRRVGQ